MEKKKKVLAGCNELRLCENEGKKAFELYFEQLMPTTQINIISIEFRDYQFIIKTELLKGK